MPLARVREPFDHPDWIYELKLDGFRSLVYIERGRARLESRNGNTFKSFPELTGAIGPALACRNAVLDGEIVHVGRDGKPQFYSLMRRRGPQYFFAFDLLWLDGRDVRGLPLLGRKRILRALVPRARCCTWITSPSAASIYSGRCVTPIWRGSWPSGRTGCIRRKKPVG